MSSYVWVCFQISPNSTELWVCFPDVLWLSLHGCGLLLEVRTAQASFVVSFWDSRESIYILDFFIIFWKCFWGFYMGDIESFDQFRWHKYFNNIKLLKQIIWWITYINIFFLYFWDFNYNICPFPVLASNSTVYCSLLPFKFMACFSLNVIKWIYMYAYKHKLFWPHNVTYLYVVSADHLLWSMFIVLMI